MTIAHDWRDTLIDDRQRKEVTFAELYAADFNHGTTGHNQLMLIARLAELLDVAVGNKELPPPPEPAEIRLTFGKHSGRMLGELLTLDYGYLEWLGREARDEALKAAACQVLALPYPEQDDEEPPY